MPAAFHARFAKIGSPSICDLRLLEAAGITCGFNVQTTETAK